MASIAIAAASDHVFNRLVAGLESEFGTRAAEGLARHFIEAEGADFYWEARVRERWLGVYESFDSEDDGALDRVAATGFLDGQHFVAVLLCDAFEGVDALLGVRQFEKREEAEAAFDNIR